jgi:hypothetical protein
MTGGRIAVVLFNRAGVLYNLGTRPNVLCVDDNTLLQPAHGWCGSITTDQWSYENVVVTWAQLGLTAVGAKYVATDLWKGNNLGVFSGYPILLHCIAASLLHSPSPSSSSGLLRTIHSSRHAGNSSRRSWLLTQCSSSCSSPPRLHEKNLPPPTAKNSQTPYK